MKNKPFLNFDECVFTEEAKSPLFKEKYAPISDLIGAKQLSYSMTIVPPGASACPFHVHHTNEELFIIIEGKGKLRFGSDVYPIRAGDVIACPIGGEENAHQIINDSDQDIKYFALSTKHEVDVCEYPDSNKFGAYSIFHDKDGKKERRLRFLGRKEMSLDYWDGEKLE